MTTAHKSAITTLTINGLTLTSNAVGFFIAGGTTSKTLTIANTLTLAGTDGTTITFPSVSGTIPLNNQQFFLGTQAIAINAGNGTITSLPGITSVNGTTIPASTNLLTSGSTTSSLTSFGASPTLTNPIITGETITAGTALIAPIKFNSSSAVLLTTPIAGALEVDSSGILYYTTTSTRQAVALGTPLTNPMAAAGDLIYGGASGAPTRLAGSATNNYVLTYNTSTNAPTWAASAGYSTITLGSTALASGSTVTTVSGLTLTAPTINGATLSGTFSGNVVRTPATATGIPLVVQGLANQTSDLLQFQNSSSVVLGSVNPAGQTYLGSNAGFSTFSLGGGGSSVTITALTFTATTATLQYSAGTQQFNAGESIQVFGFTPSGYNGYFNIQSVATISAGSTYSITMLNSTNTTATVIGLVGPSPYLGIYVPSKSASGLLLSSITGINDQGIASAFAISSSTGTFGISWSGKVIMNQYKTNGGTTTIAPYIISAGTNLTTPLQGAIEYDGNAMYFTASPSAGRGTILSSLFAYNSTTKALSSATGNQSLFAKPSTGALTLAGSTTYRFKAVVNLNTGTTTTHTVSFNFGGTATFNFVDFYTSFLNVANAGTPTAETNVHFISAAGGVISLTGILASKSFTIEGLLSVNASGTIIPQIAFSAAPGGTNTVGIGSFMEFIPITTSSTTSVGAWA